MDYMPYDYYDMNTPILLITFNRPEHTRRVLGAILAAGPQELYVFQDGARDGNDVDVKKCEEVRQVIAGMVEGTQVKLHQYCSTKNLGCGPGPVTGITWFFDHVEQGIVMEDDCLPHPDFFGYCEELLEKYKNVEEVQFINAALYNNRWKCDQSYGFSRYQVAGAWASWRRFWISYDVDLKSVDAKAFHRKCKKLLLERAEADWWYFKLLEIQKDKAKKSYWDYQCLITLLLNSGITIMPKRNLISNIGFDGEGTHTLTNDGKGGRKAFPILPLDHPGQIVVDKKRDASCFAKVHSEGFVKDRMAYLYRSMNNTQGFPYKLLLVYKKLKSKFSHSK